MTRKTYLSLFVILLTASIASAAEEVRGVVSRFDPAKKELVIEGRGRRVRNVPFTFTVPSDAKVTIGRQPGALADLKPGTRVSVLYENRDGGRVALGITVHGALLREALKPAPAAGDANAVVGKLIRVAQTDREVVVLSGADAERTIAVPKDATITRDQKAITLDDLKEGEQVTVHTEMRDGKRVARSIEVGVAAPSERVDRIEKLRRLLRMADQALEMAQQRQQNKP
jgi:cold shock CspA family protein